MAQSQKDHILNQIPEWIMVKRISTKDARDKLGIKIKLEA